MDLKYKPDFEDTKSAWRHFWAHEPWERPLVWAEVPRDPASPLPPDLSPHTSHYWNAVNGLWDRQKQCIDAWLDHTEFLAEAIPSVCTDFGPDQFAAFLGATLQFSGSAHDTNWVEPIVEDWNTFQIRLDPSNPTWLRFLEYVRTIADHVRNRCLVAMNDLHSNADALSALRGPSRLCMDICERPDEIERAMLAVRELYQPVYQTIYRTAGMNAETGTIGWAPFWCDGRFATIQCDFICMVSPALSRKMIIPALEEEAEFLDHCAYHLDGPNALPHLDDILAIPGIDVIQWVSGIGQPPMQTWLDVLRRCLKAGKGLQLYGIGPNETRALHRELGPGPILYGIGARDAAEVRELLKWLKRNT